MCLDSFCKFKFNWYKTVFETGTKYNFFFLLVKHAHFLAFSSLPDGVRVITPSRRITTTVLKQGKSTKKSTLKDVKETGHRPESPGVSVLHITWILIIENVRWKMH